MICNGARGRASGSMGRDGKALPVPPTAAFPHGAAAPPDNESSAILAISPAHRPSPRWLPLLDESPMVVELVSESLIEGVCAGAMVSARHFDPPAIARPGEDLRRLAERSPNACATLSFSDNERGDPTEVVRRVKEGHHVKAQHSRYLAPHLRNEYPVILSVGEERDPFSHQRLGARVPELGQQGIDGGRVLRMGDAH